MTRLFGTYVRLYREALSGFPRATWLLAAITLVHRMGQMVLLFQTLYFKKVLGFDEAVIGSLLLCYGIGNAVGAYFGGWLCDRMSAVTVQGAALAINGAALIALPLAPDLPPLFLLMALVGVAGTAFRPAASTLLVSTCPPARRAQAFAFFRLPINLGCGLGPLIGGELAEIDYRLVFWVEGGVCLLTAVLVSILLRGRVVAPVEEDVAPENDTRSPWRDRLFLLLVFNTGMLAFIVVQWFTAGTLFLDEEFGMSEEEIGRVFALNPLLIVLFEMILVQSLGDRKRLPWIAGSGWLVSASCFVLLLGVGWPFAVFSVTLWTVAEMMESPLTGAFVASRAGRANRGRYMGVYTLSYSLAHGIAPATAVWIYGELGPTALWTIAGVVAAILALAVGLAARRHDL
ncbi:MAG: MFS transporter [Planctomycetes bacterium]|nr:MFS transporter [Planctomycetota bacterium]